MCLLTIFFYFVIVHLDLFFFFQAEDGIRDRNVTRVQTCALPILCRFSGTSISDLTLSLYAVHSSFLTAKFFSRKSISFSKVCFLNLAVSICLRSEPRSPRFNSKPCF